MLRRRTAHGWVTVTAGELHNDVHRLASGLITAGIRPADRVVIFSRTRYEWVIVDAALWAIGAISVPLNPAAHIEQIRWVLRDSGAIAGICERTDQAELLTTMQDLTFQCSIEADGGTSWFDNTMSHLAHLTPQDVAEQRGPAGAQSPVTLVYPDGVTTRPRGCVLSHGNLLAAAFSSARSLSPISTDEKLTTLVYQPLADVTQRVAVLRALLFATPIGLSDPAKIAADCEDLKPDILVGSPRFLERLYRTAYDRARQAGKEKKFRTAVSVSVAASLSATSAKTTGTITKKGGMLSRIHAALGGNLRWFISGTAPFPRDLARFFDGIGIRVLEGYGFAESSGVATQNRPHDVRFGTQGPPVDGVEVHIGDEGEISVRGPNVFSGYFDEATTLRRSVDPGGWFTTNDMGTWHDEFLKYTGHLHDLILTSNGSLVSPFSLEDALRTHQLIAHAVVVGEGQATLGVLLTLDHDATAAWLAERDQHDVAPTDLATHPEVISEMRVTIETLNDSIAIREQIRRIKVLPGSFTHESGQLTAAMKINRRKILHDYADDIAGLYQTHHIPMPRH